MVVIFHNDTGCSIQRSGEKAPFPNPRHFHKPHPKSQDWFKEQVTEKPSVLGKNFRQVYGVRYILPLERITILVGKISH